MGAFLVYRRTKAGQLAPVEMRDRNESSDTPPQDGYKAELDSSVAESALQMCPTIAELHTIYPMSEVHVDTCQYRSEMAG